MSPSPSPEVHLTVTAGSPLAEVFLINEDFALVKRSVGDLECDVAPGVYKIKSKLGDATAERLLLLDENQTLDISSDLTVSSPVPYTGSVFERARDFKGRRTPNAHVAPPADDRTQVLLMTRIETPSGDTSADPPTISLHRLDGTTIESLAPRAGSPHGARSMTIEVDPGAYLVRRRDRLGDTAEQCVYAVEGWQTQVFTFEEAGDEADIGRTRVSVLMSQHGFDPRNPHLPVIEDARTALADERKIASEALGDLFEAIDNPMLALFGAHLMLVARDAALKEDQQRASGRLGERAVTAPVRFDQGRFDQIVDRLYEVLGPEHADVVALTTQRTNQTLQSLQPLSAPPMLWRSWVLLIAASNAMPTLVPVNAWKRSLHVLPLRPFFLGLRPSSPAQSARPGPKASPPPSQVEHPRRRPAPRLKGGALPWSPALRPPRKTTCAVASARSCSCRERRSTGSRTANRSERAPGFHPRP